jgi:putative glycerol-1-phosphate prenyltransferase
MKEEVLMIETKAWRHVFKLDPDKAISNEALEALCESGSDAIIVGGTYGVTFDDTIELLSRIRRYAIPCVLEVSNHEAIVPGFDHYFIPFVLNATDPEWILKPHYTAVKEIGNIIPWHDISMLGYCVLNPDSGVARLTKSDTHLHKEDILAYGRMALHMFKLPYLYIEYSGSYGSPDIVSKVYETLKREGNLHIFYGGGITHKEKALEMCQWADTVVVGNIIYDDLKAALDTVHIK